jgi:phage I-like protein
MTKPAALSQTEAILASAIEIGLSGDGVAKQIKLLPYGTFMGRDGRGPYRLDGKEHAGRVIAATRAYFGGNDMMVDYDHQSALAAVPGVGGTAEAAGWIKLDTLEAREDGIYASVEWTEDAEQALRKRKYRYHSPFFFRRPDTGEVTRIRNAGLTNSPNLELPALASEEVGATGEPELMTQIAKAPLVTALGLPANAGEAEVLAAIGGLKTKADTGEKVLASTRAKLGLAEDADGEAVLAAIDAKAGAGEPDPRKFVPIDALKSVQDQLAEIREEKILAMVDDAVAGGKLTPAQKDWAVRLGKTDIGELQSFLGSAPVFPGAKPHGDGKVPSRHTQLTEEEVIACEMTGTSHEDFLKAKNEEIGA